MIERYSKYMLVEADTSSEETGTDLGDPEEGNLIAAMDDPPTHTPCNTERELSADSGRLAKAARKVEPECFGRIGR